MNAKLKLKSRDNDMEVDNAVSEKSKYLIIFFFILNTQIRTLNYYLFVFIVPRIDDQLFTLEPLADHVSFIFILKM